MLKPGQTAPEFELPDVNGQVVKLPELLRDGPVILVFFKVSCPTCQLSLPFLGRMSGINIAAISQDDAEITRMFLKRFSPGLRTLIDPAQGWYPVSASYALTHVPALFVVEQDRRISFALNGFDREQFEALGRRFDTVLFGRDEKTPQWKPG